MKENWINDMKRKLEGHKMEPPKGLWESICSQMGHPSESKSPSRMTGTAQWYWAAAAAILALVGFFVMQNGNDAEQPQQANTVSQQMVPKQPTSQPLATTNAIEQEPQTEKPLLAQVHHHKVNAVSNLVEETPPPVTESQTEEALTASESPVADSSVDLQQAPDKAQTNTKTEMVPNDPAPQYESVPKHDARSSSKKWSFGLSASGGLLPAANNVRTDRIEFFQKQGNWYSPSDKVWADPGESPSIKDGYIYNYNGHEYIYIEKDVLSYTRTEFVSKHHLPVRFGLSVQFQLNNRLALLSGINYTYLYSEFSIPLYQNIHDSQKLHYLGIPFGLAWQLWSTNHFRFYLSGGAMVEKCIHADFEAGSTGKKPWQWSVNAAAGAEYTFIRQLGVYLEPSLGYYFDDGTSLEHYYKEHPLAPSIEFGLRLHLNDK